ncbi:sigma-70 family RNA polymerase sigma factor [Haloferula sp. BvORR071]|uniref:sigma-70 family RNA polymerase sigma factor n=1 Tax=Haloferula sp. BvORR071 TaxID=1396141 RepID=UPI00054EC3EA|nr:sigma-70 family RNA polymerase sigma factor [Haloferula sp. BvORR071]
MNARQLEYLQLVTRHQAAILGYIRSIAPGAPVDDILQETNVILWERAASFEPGTHFKAFAFRIAHLKTLEFLRTSKRRAWLVFDSDLLEAISQRQSEQEASNADAQAALSSCLADLDPDERELLHRRYTLRHSVRDIAKTDGKTEGSLQQLFFRLRNQLRACIEQRMIVEGGDA